MIKNNKFRGLAAAAAVAALFTAQPAAADVVSINGWWAGAEGIHFDYTGTGPDLHTNAYAGGFNTTINGNTIQSFCVDIFDHFQFVATSNSTPSPAAAVISAQAAEDLGRLYSNHVSAVTTDAGSVNEAAFQLAVWEIVNEQSTEFSYNLDNGTFAAQGWNGASPNSAVTLANTWLSGLSIPSVSAYNATIWTVNSMISGEGHAQDVVTFTSVPEPETYAMMLVGLGLLGFSARRKSQF